MQLGYALSSEEHAPLDLIRYAQHAEEAGFDFALISDHYHPWVMTAARAERAVWCTIGASRRRRRVCDSAPA
jgi:alkanesulfonate monooxygenase SsuD/methylene tetrahydromethanopterin reductase-like flavin-dependent oxidoreductase (luciferase family)